MSQYQLQFCSKSVQGLVETLLSLKESENTFFLLPAFIIVSVIAKQNSATHGTFGMGAGSCFVLKSGIYNWHLLL